MGILFGLLTALSWGGADFLARFATHRVGALRTLLYMQAAGFVMLTISLPWLGGLGHLRDGWHSWAWGALAGGINAGATLMLYRSFEIGKISIVAPISAGYPAVSVLLSLLSGERLTVFRGIGIVCILLGVIIVAGGEQTPTDDDANTVQRTGQGVGWAIGAGLGFGVLLWLLGMHVVPRLGAVPAVWMIRLTGTILMSVVLLFARHRPTSKSAANLRIDSKTLSLALGGGFFDTGAFVLNNRGMLLEQVSIVSVLASLYGAVTVALAALFLRERVTLWQWFGIAAIFVGIFLISR